MVFAGGESTLLSHLASDAGRDVDRTGGSLKGVENGHQRMYLQISKTSIAVRVTHQQRSEWDPALSVNQRVVSTSI